MTENENETAPPTEADGAEAVEVAEAPEAPEAPEAEVSSGESADEAAPAAEAQPAEASDADEDGPEPSEEPEIPLDQIDKDALWVVRRLRAKGHEAYLTGGCVRDLLIGREPKDFDVATAAHPGEVKKVFRNCRLIGRRFRLAHVYFPGGKVIETATFRANPLDELEDLPDDLLVERDNVFGNVEEDARRRDLTINGLFYDPIDGKVLDYVDGRVDLEQRLIRTIGDPQVRFAEDPVRILRAIKFATRLGFDFEKDTYQAMKDNAEGLLKCAPPRLQDELLRLLSSGHGALAMRLCQDVGVLDVLVPELLEAMSAELAAPSEPATKPEASSADDADAEASADATEAQAEKAEEETPAEPSEPPPPPPSPEERWARFFRVLDGLDQIRDRGADLSSCISFSAFLLPAFEAIQASNQDEGEWFDKVTETWIERLRFTRRDRDDIRTVLQALESFEPGYRAGAMAKQLVSRPWFKDGLMVFTLSRFAAGNGLEEIGQWKAIAAHYEKAYRQPRKGERQAKPRRSRRGRGGSGRSGGGRSGGGRSGGRRGGRGRGRS
jgi:tRNA nucleotidyltransferase/poly(A) polymerase